MQFATDLRKQILVVEDEALIAADLQSRLERLGYNVPAIARSGKEALQLAEERAVDLVLMDIRLHGAMDGIVAAQALRTSHATPVVYITAHADRETIERAKLTEPYGYIIKPISDGDLHSTVEIAIYKSEMERRVRASEAWLSATLKSIGEGVIATNTNGEVVFLNPVAQQMTGWAGTSSHGRLLMEVLRLHHESTGALAKNPVYDLTAGETLAYTLVSRTGEKTEVEIGCSENHADDELLGAIVVARDIRTRRELESRLIQSQRMEAVANLAGGLAHDFNNQLTVMLGYAEEMCERLTGKDREEALQIKHSATIAGSLANQLLTLSRREIVHLAVLSLNEVICEIQPMISHSLGKSLTLATSLGTPAGFVRCDRNRLKQVIFNLALNARDAMTSGGELTIQTSQTEIDASGSEARLYRPGSYARLVVTDTGAGMDAETLAHAFEPFFTTKKPGFGTGLGLSVVHGNITQSGGSIAASSEPGHGTRFEILLPSVGSFQPFRQDAMENAARATETVLLVVDVDSVRRLMHNYLEREGYQLLEARSGEEAEAIEQVYTEPIHLLVTDVIMPGMTGRQLAERIQVRRPAIKVLYVSGYRHDALAADSTLPPGPAVLPKPFVASELLRRIRILLASASPVIQ
jgi:PAS domain S-box-containing protein